MIELFLRTVVICFLMEIGSASNFTMAAMASSSERWPIVLIGGVVGLMAAGILAIRIGSFLEKLPISSNTISGMVMLIMGIVFLLKDSAN